METLTSINQTNPDLSSSQGEENPTSVRNSSWESKSHAEKAAFLEDVYTTIEKPEIASGTMKGEVTQVENHRFASKVVPRPRFEKRLIRQASEDYLQIIRAYYMKLILQSVHNIQPHAGTPNASVYIHKILHIIRDFDEKSPDDPILEILFAFYDALAYDNQWTAYTSIQFEEAEEILNRVTRDTIKAKDIEKAIAALDNVGFDTIPYQFSLEDDML